MINGAGDPAAGEYECDVTNDCDTATSDPADLTVCIADFNGDGLLGSQDFFDFLNAYAAQSPLVDYNRDGLLNSLDFFEYLNRYVEGCD